MKGIRDQYAEFVCGTCSHEFSDKVPPLEEKLPKCPMCNGLVRIFAMLVPLYWLLDQIT